MSQLKDISEKDLRAELERREAAKALLCSVIDKGVNCQEPVTWIRCTQFSGDHRFCTKHAELENDFGQSDPSDFYWEEVPINNTSASR